MIPTAEQLSALARIEQARTELDAAMAERAEAIRAAVELGVPKADVARAAGVTRQTVYNVCR